MPRLPSGWVSAKLSKTGPRIWLERLHETPVHAPFAPDSGLTGQQSTVKFPREQGCCMAAHLYEGPVRAPPAWSEGSQAHPDLSKPRKSLNPKT